MRKNVNKLSSIAEGGTNGVRWSDVIQLYIKSNKKLKIQPLTSQMYMNKCWTVYYIHYGLHNLVQLISGKDGSAVKTLS